jgi:catechol 2,3-dioxygenase-like lactoylglutathione lyase family enzyme
MTVLALDHVNLRTAEPARTLSFFRDVLLMQVGGPNGMAAGERGGWVYAGDGAPVVHVGALESPYSTDARIPFEPARGGGAVHHVALSCADFEGVKARLRRLDVEFVENALPSRGLRQIFVAEPNGVLFELNFRDGQA